VKGIAVVAQRRDSANEFFHDSFIHLIAGQVNRSVQGALYFFPAQLFLRRDCNGL
jgi:hypothetical protein